MKSYPEKRVSMSFYAADVKALRRLNLALRDAGADVLRLDTLRLLVYATSEAEMFSHAALRLQKEAHAPRHDGNVEERCTVTFPQDLIDKLGNVVDDLARKDLDAERTFVVRATLHAAHDVKSLARALPTMEQEYPDKRSLRGKRRA